MNSKKEGVPMQPEKETGFVPKLRFPESLGYSRMEICSLNKLSETLAPERSRITAITRVLTNSAEYGVVDQRDYFDKDIATQGNLESYYVVEKGDYVYNPRISTSAPVGPISKNNVATGVMSPLYTVFRFGDSRNEFMPPISETSGWASIHRAKYPVKGRGTRQWPLQMMISRLCPFPYQRRKSNRRLLTASPRSYELITLEAKKLDAIKAHKKGLVQQVFPAEGETLPKLRFPEFQGSCEWTPKPLGEICNMQAGKFVAASEILESQGDGLYPCFGGNGLRGYTKTFNQSGRYSLIGRQGALWGCESRQWHFPCY